MTEMIASGVAGAKGAAAQQETVQAKVSAAHRGLYEVLCQRPDGDVQLAAQLKPGVYYSVEAEMPFPAVGDDVLLQPNPGGTSLIVETLPRRSLFYRSDFSGHVPAYVKTVLQQVVAANFDYVFVVAALNCDYNPRRIERYLAQSWQSGGQPVVVLNKADLAADTAPYLAEVAALAPGVPVAAVSAKTGQGLEELAPYVVKGKTVVLLGSSGVGKSSIVNALCGESHMKVNAVREDDSKGRHTTTHRQMLPLVGGGLLIDTPGMRELGLYDAGDGVRGLFGDVQELVASCRFSDCGHGAEPGCAVRAALESGALPQERWRSYQNLQRENAFVQQRTARQEREAARQEKTAVRAARQKKKSRKGWQQEDDI